MKDFQKSLGDTVRKARKEAHLSQVKTATSIDVDKRTILNMEKYDGNPKLEILFPLVRLLHIDPWDIFYPEVSRSNPSIQKFLTLLSGCSQQEIEALYPVCQEVIHAMRKGHVKSVQSDT